MGTVENITKAASFMKVSPGKIRYNSEKIITRYVPKTNESISGYSSILQSLARESKNELIRDIYKDIETELQVVQWIDYSVLFVSPAAKDKHVLKALLEVNLQPLDKEHYLNISRWFNHLQQQKAIRQDEDMINFSTLLLLGWAMGTHV
ncbi:uncharacterized protein LOC131682771 isoform X3 [Topomyia yanbarensis]|uniref:uncharacterized protein LOC131682771 isoform X3 n=1 Tax=Topomyia yanbarensis TaxID=2498891 RepID=UPI00273ACE74|nr:uncharacterized protein LOC131682771 isoform X3 [Topomyia yanbarensis]